MCTYRSARTNTNYSQTNGTFVLLTRWRSLGHLDFFIDRFDVQCRLAFDCHRRLASLRVGLKDITLKAPLHNQISNVCNLIVYALSLCTYISINTVHFHFNRALDIVANGNVNCSWSQLLSARDNEIKELKTQ